MKFRNWSRCGQERTLNLFQVLYVDPEPQCKLVKVGSGGFRLEFDSRLNRVSSAYQLVGPGVYKMREARKVPRSKIEFDSRLR